LGGSWFQASLGKKWAESLEDPISTEIKLGVVAQTCHPSYGRNPKLGGSPSRVALLKGRPHLKNNHRKKGWSYGSSSRVPSYQESRPEFKVQYPKENKSILNILSDVASYQRPTLLHEPNTVL
jgi:hypothetical protein